MNTLLILFLNRSFLDLVEKNQKPVFLNQRVLPISEYNLKWHEKFQIYRLHTRDSDWLDFIHFSRYKIRLVSILRKREDQALISISTILKFSAQADQRKMRTIVTILNRSFLNKDRFFYLSEQSILFVNFLNNTIVHEQLFVLK